MLIYNQTIFFLKMCENGQTINFISHLSPEHKHIFVRRDIALTVAHMNCKISKREREGKSKKERKRERVCECVSESVCVEEERGTGISHHLITVV